jgi:hypothetical protein
MSLGVLIISFALHGAPAAATSPAKGSRFEQGQKLYNQGDVESALKLLDAAAQEEREPAVLEKVHLLRGQCFSARHDFVRAEDAFALALDANPDTSLDPARVDPTVVKLLEAVRMRLTATLIVTSSPPGANVFLDSKNAGVAPQTLQAPIGKHRVEARWGDGPLAPVELVFKPKKEVRIEFVQGPAPAPQMVTVQPEQQPLRPYGDVRGIVDVPANGAAPRGGIDLGGGIEFGVSMPTGGLDHGGGLKFSLFRIGLLARLFPDFGVVPRAAWVVPLIPKLNFVLEVHVPLLFRNEGIGLGFGGLAGGEFWALPWFGAFVGVGGQHLFKNDRRNDNTTFHATAGVRLRLP